MDYCVAVITYTRWVQSSDSFGTTEYLSFAAAIFCPVHAGHGYLSSWEAYQNRGIKRDAAGDHLGAAEDFAYAIRNCPPNTALRFLRGVALLHAADPQGAAAELEAGLKLDPNNATLRSPLDQARRLPGTDARLRSIRW
jgi:tetratricopeptide (TPR) repeat protein